MMILDAVFLTGVLTKVATALAGSSIVYAGRRIFNWFDFVPRRLESVGIGSFFSPFQATSPGDQYTSALMIEIKNQSGKPLYIVRAIYFLEGRKKLPVYENAWHSQKKPKGYELKFGNEPKYGTQWWSIDTLVAANEKVNTYLPLAKSVNTSEYPQGSRGRLYLEYIFDGKTGIHSAKL